MLTVGAAAEAWRDVVAIGEVETIVTDSGFVEAVNAIKTKNATNAIPKIEHDCLRDFNLKILGLTRPITKQASDNKNKTMKNDDMGFVVSD